jgi:hypothetical protein
MSIKICLLGLLLSLPIAYASKAELLDTQQKQVIQRFFSLKQLLIPGQADFKKGTVSLVRDHSKQTWSLSLQFSKTVKQPSAKKSQLYLFRIWHHTVNKAVSDDYQCRKNLKKSRFRHAQLGTFVVCSQVNQSKKQNTGLPPLLTAWIFPLSGNKFSGVEMDYSGSKEDLVAVLKSLRGYTQP